MCGRGTEADRSSAVPNALCAKRIKWLFGAIGFQTAIILGPVVVRTTAFGSAALALLSSGLFPVIKIPPIKTNDDND